MLDGQETYKHLNTNPTLSTTKYVNKFVNNFLKTIKITEETSFRLKNSDVITPQLYGLSKLHKQNIPLQPIVFLQG